MAGGSWKVPCYRDWSLGSREEGEMVATWCHSGGCTRHRGSRQAVRPGNGQRDESSAGTDGEIEGRNGSIVGTEQWPVPKTGKRVFLLTASNLACEGVKNRILSDLSVTTCISAMLCLSSKAFVTDHSQRLDTGSGWSPSFLIPDILWLCDSVLMIMKVNLQMWALSVSKKITCLPLPHGGFQQFMSHEDTSVIQLHTSYLKRGPARFSTWRVVLIITWMHAQHTAQHKPHHRRASAITSWHPEHLIFCASRRSSAQLF